jgi:lysophospholipase L1-like esterase
LLQATAAAINPTYSLSTGNYPIARMMIFIPGNTNLILGATNTITIQVKNPLTKFYFNLSQHQTETISVQLLRQFYNFLLSSRQTLIFNDLGSVTVALALNTNQTLILALRSVGATFLNLVHRNSVAINLPGKTLIKLTLNNTTSFSENQNSGPVSTPESCIDQIGSGSSTGQINLVCDGDSLTAGYFNSLNYGNYPMQLGQLINAISVTNLGVAGATISPGANSIQNHNVPAIISGIENVLSLFAGTNDLILGIPVSTITSSLFTYVAAKTTLGYLVTVCTLPKSNYAGNPSNYDSNRALVNGYIRANFKFVDLDADPRLANPTPITSDGLHYNNIGYGYVAQDVAFRMIQLGLYA